MSQTFTSLQFFNYRLWFAGALVSNVGTWMQRIAQDWLVLTVLTQDSGVAVGVTTGLQFLPFLFLAPYSGVIADRVDVRKLLFATQGAAAALALVLGVLVLTDHAQLWHVYVLATGLGVVSAFDAPARQAFVPSLVPTENLPNAVGLNSASFNAARLIGPAAAGLVIAAVGTGWVFIVNGFTFIATIAALALMRVPQLHVQERARRGGGQIREGIRYVRRRADLVIIMVVVSVVSAFGLNFQLTSALMARTEFGRGPSEYGVLGSILAIGSLSGALLAARRKRPRLRFIVGSAGLFGVSASVMALMPTYGTYALACIPVGFAALTLLTSANAWIQTTTAPSMRGRVMALYITVLLGSTPIGSPVVGWIGEHWGARWAIGVGAVTAILVAAGAALWSIRYWNLELSYARRRPFVRVAYGRTSAQAEQAAREAASLKVRDQQIEDVRRQP